MENPITISCQENPRALELALHSTQMWNMTKNRISSTHLRAPQVVSFLAQDSSGKSVGGFLVRETFGVFYVDAFWVDDEHRKTGIGKQLLDTAIAYGKKINCSYMIAYTYEFYDAQMFLQRNYKNSDTIGKVENCPPPYTLYVVTLKLCE